jgi:hypothetical protein
MSGDTIQPMMNINKQASAFESALIGALRDEIELDPASAYKALTDLKDFQGVMQEAQETGISQGSADRTRFIHSLATVWTTGADLRIKYDNGTERQIHRSETYRNRFTKIATYIGRRAAWQAKHSADEHVHAKSA